MQRCLSKSFPRFKKQHSKFNIEVIYPKNTSTVVLNKLRSDIDLDLNSRPTIKQTWVLFHLPEPQCSHMYNGDNNTLSQSWVISFARCFIYFFFSILIPLYPFHIGTFVFPIFTGVKIETSRIYVFARSHVAKEMFALGYNPRNLNLSIKVFKYTLYSLSRIEYPAYRKHLINIYHHPHHHHHYRFYFCYYHSSIVTTMTPANTHCYFYYHCYN